MFRSVFSLTVYCNSRILMLFKFTEDGAAGEYGKIAPRPVVEANKHDTGLVTTLSLSAWDSCVRRTVTVKPKNATSYPVQLMVAGRPGVIGANAA